MRLLDGAVSRISVICVWGRNMFRKVLSIALLSSAVALAGCSSKGSSGSKRLATHNSKGESLAGFVGKGSPLFRGNGKIPRGGGKFQVGKPYEVAGVWFEPKEQPGYDRKGAASWYGEAFHGRKTSNGEYFDMNMLSAAHPTLPLPSYAKVTNLANGKSVVVRINDRGPFVGTRIIDLSKRSADALQFRSKGKANVRVQWIGNAPIDDQGAHLAMMNKKLGQGASVNTLVAAASGRSDRNESVQLANYEPEQPEQARRAESQIIQIGSFASLDEAEAVRTQLSSIGPIQVYEWDTANGAVYKVQMGPFRSEIGAKDALSAVRNEGFDAAKLKAARIEQAAYQH
jgi:rare lipoprotein A